MDYEDKVFCSKFLKTFWDFTPNEKELDYMMNSGVIKSYSKLKTYLIEEKGRKKDKYWVKL